MKGVYKIAAATPRLLLGNPAANARECARLAHAAAAAGVAAVVFPELALTGYTCGDLFFRDDLLDDAEAALRDFAAATAALPSVSIVGYPQRAGNAILNTAAVVAGGAIAGTVRKRTLPSYREYYESRQFAPAPHDEPVKVFDAGGFRFGVEICEDLWAAVPPSAVMAAVGVDVVFNLSASTDYLGKAARRTDMVRLQSSRLRGVYAMACAGPGESSADAVFGGGSLIAADGRLLAVRPLFAAEGSFVAATIDFDELRFARRSNSSLGGARLPPEMEARRVALDVRVPTAGPTRVSRTPFLDKFGAPGWHHALLGLQATALARRMESAPAQKLVVGVSGGADSALALLGATAALDRLGLPRANLVAVVMPGFGSTERTQTAAAALGRAVGATVRVIDIRSACRRHLADIGHAEEVHDIAYENVQARERTQVLMDVANMEGALVVGTGDLSEIALGWNTYNGDHMSMYQINGSVPKTMVLEALRLVAAESDAPLSTLLASIAAAPITPELLPGAAPGDTEERLGRYELHDFLLYHCVAGGASPEKLLALATMAFRGAFPADEIARAHTTFLRRFRHAQYKRNCVPDGPKITLSLSPRADWRMPSDIPDK